MHRRATGCYQMSSNHGELSSQGWSYRDIKPDNILLDEKGHAHLTDFNIAVHFTERRALTSVAGSMAYMGAHFVHSVSLRCAVIDGESWVGFTDNSSRGARQAGLFRHRRLVVSRRRRLRAPVWQTTLSRQNQLEFDAGHPERPGQVPGECRRINQSRRSRLPQRGQSSHGHCASERVDIRLTLFRRQLLQRDPKKRLGCPGTGGLEAFKRHPWFKEYDWRVIEAKEATPPFEPDVRPDAWLCLFSGRRTRADVGCPAARWRTQSKKANFDATHELEELLLEDNPLKARKRNPNLDVSELSADYRMMEQQCVIIQW